MRWAQVAAGLVRVSLSAAMQYRADFVMDAVTGVVRAVAAVVPLVLLFDHRDTVAGWTEGEVTLVVGLFFLMQGLLSVLVEPNLGEIVEAIRTGSLDFVLLKPADAQLLVSLRRVDPGPVWTLLAALGLVAWSVARMPPPSPADVAAAAVLLLAGMAAMYGLWLMAICASFWFVRVDNLRFLLWAVTDAGRWPLDVFARWVQVGLLVVVPVGLLTTFPAMALRGTWTGGTVAFGVGVGLAFLAVSRAAWRAALASYTSASS
ncbi:MAG: ABC-2 family transporter protein [Myxococcota bacterium]